MYNNEPESEYIYEPTECYIGNRMTDVEILHVTRINVIARGRRYGRLWLIKGLVKDLRQSTAMRRQIIKEFEIHSRLRHPSVVQAVGLEEVGDLGLCIIQEWVEGTTLSEALCKGKLKKVDRRRILFEIVAAVAYLHSRGVVHRDIKPSNVMLRSAGGNAVLIDFGLADTGDYVEFKQSGGTPGFISPEQIERGGANPADDVYSLGVIMKELYQEYGAIARQCTGPLDRRPTNASELQKALQSRMRLPRLATTAVAIASIAIIGVATGIHISRLSDSARKAYDRVEILTADNLHNLERVSVLTDSLQYVSGRMNKAESELSRIENYNRTKEEITQKGYKIIDSLIQRHDRKVFSKLSPNNSLEYNDHVLRLNKEITNTIDNYVASQESHNSLSEPDCMALRFDLNNYHSLIITDYYKKWLLKIHPDLNLTF